VSRDRVANIYSIWHSEGYERFLPVDRNQYDLLIFDGTPRAASWKPIRMRRLRFTERGQFPQPCDFPAGSGGTYQIMSHVAREKIGLHIEKYGEFLPLGCEWGKFWAFHVTRFVDALDEDASDVLRATDEPALVLMIHKHVFQPAKLTSDWMFKLPQSRGRGTFYVTDPFVNLIRESGLTGLYFRREWTSS
jgi:hypothetical protein